MSIKGLIFDLDGVLVDTVPTHFAAWSRMFHEFGYAFDHRDYLRLVDGRLRLDGARAVMTDASDDVVLEAASLKNQYYLEAINRGEFNIFEPAIRRVREFEREGYLIAAASSSANVRHILETIGIIDAFTAIVGGPDVTHGKPHPEIFLTAAAGLGLDVQDCIVVEDAESGIAAAKAGGFYCYGLQHPPVGNSITHTADLSAADQAIKSLDEIDLAQFT
jgi:beta-phosphoglucomutase family hydrolase